MTEICGGRPQPLGRSKWVLRFAFSAQTVRHERRMQDAFTGQTTRIRGSVVPGAEEQGRLQHDHERRLEALDRLGAAAEKCGLRADSDQDLVLLAEDEVSLLEGAGDEW